MADLFLTPRAEQDLRDLWRFIAEGNPDAADRVVLGIHRRMQALRRFPRLGPARPDIAADARVLVIGTVLVLYAILPDREGVPVGRVEVVAVVDGRRDLAALFLP
ncbi:type II toxin-antitoxin system RelE/ParE family toxin [Paracraurococcus lichenis]|uniref:Type II toxin-antitoxin system RelE/ParE family toxin n=1 Tax=Paracraurococcus lichenis TaxID=3064888 RepID=A0ABT9DW98_9PROT|nr:type II toxin-antitoxin system RelE/ParE family toxin [Paracraurococcus sp. LOR1-02]MDO9708175.1 type II toxin-antitoxin system RelE/ParE family toxin [Paracraurococcus sp. LOR1-02]